MKNIIVHQYENVRSKWLSGSIMSHDGVLQFIDTDGKEVVARFVPFLANEVAPASDDPEMFTPDTQH